jgi:hypothetical protein
MKENYLFWVVLIILFLCVYTIVLVNYFLKKISNTEHHNIIKQYSSEVMKLRFQAFERFTLLLERLSPESLILRVQDPKMSIIEYHAQLLKVIRHEFNHNIAMQIYISSKTYDKIKIAKEKLLMLVNSSLLKLNPKSPSIELGKIIIEDADNEVNHYFISAINAIRNEIEEHCRI